MSSIRILNIFYIYCYAWRLLREGTSLTVDTTDSPNSCEFFARVLLNGIRLLLRRGLERGYSEREDELTGLRGRIVIGDSVRRMSIQRGKATCRFDEIRHNTTNNRIIKATLEILSKSDGLANETRGAIWSINGRFSDIEPLRLSTSVFTQISLYRNNSYYELVLRLCEFIYKHLLPAEANNKFRFADPMDDETRMSTVFEEFIRVSCQTEINWVGGARRENIRWEAGEMDELHASYLPKMQTDVTLRSANRIIIVDAKFYKQVFSDFRGAEKIGANNLYQMFSYLKNCDDAAEGLLIYPSSAEPPITLYYTLGGHIVKIGTVNLDQQWKGIDNRLRELVSQKLEQHF